MRPSKAGKMTDPLRSLAQNGKDDRHMKYSLLKAERKQREWSQAEVAEALGVSIKTVSRWEQGQAVPHPYYRSKLSTLFGKTAEELGLLSHIDENEATQPNRELCLPSDADGNDAIQEVTLSIAQSKAPDVPTQASFLANPIIPQDLESVNNLRGRDGSFMRLDEWELRSPKYDLFSHQSLWSHMSGMSIFRPFNRLSSRHVPIPLKILLTLAIIITVLLVFILQPLYHSTHGGSPSPPPANTSVPATYSPPLYTLTIQNTDPSSLNTAQHFNQDFNAVYPQLVNRFALNPAIAPLNVTLTFSSDQSYAAVTNGTTININSNWVRQHPTDVGLITHELTLIVEQYPSGAPGWFADGIADYARSVYGPADDDNWSLPNGVQPQDNYLQGGAVAACFLQWLEQHTTLDIVDQLNHALQRGQSLSTVFRRLTHHTVDELWRQYQAHPNIIQTPEQLYKTVISRKPLYQISSLDLQISQPRSYAVSVIPGLFVSNFAVQADMTTIRGDGGGFIFRWQTIHNNLGDPQYRLRLRPIADRTLGTFDLVDPDNILAFGSNSAIKQGYNQTNRLAIIAQKHTIYLYVNNRFITKVDNSLSSNGILAAMGNDDSNPADVRFEHIQVF